MSSSMSLRTILRALLAGAALAAVGASGAVAQAIAPVSPELATRAEAEGTVVIYSSQTTEFLDGLVASFQAAYPNVKMEYLKDSSAGISERLLSEQAAGHHVADVYIAWWDTVSRIVAAGETASYTPEQAAGYDPSLVDPDGHWHIVGFNPMLIGYNTDSVSAEDAPKTWSDLLDPKWNTQIGTYDPRIGGGGYAYYYGMWKLHGDDFMTGLGANKPFVQGASAALASAVASGQLQLASIGYTGWSALLGEAPIALVVPEDGVPMMDMMVSVIDDAPHPEAARLFVSWLMSEAGQNAVPTGASAIYAALASAPPPEGVPPLSEIKRVETNYDEYISEEAAITDKAAAALGLSN